MIRLAGTLALLLFAAHLGAQTTQPALSPQLAAITERLHKAGEPVTVADLIVPIRIPDEKNGAKVIETLAIMYRKEKAAGFKWLGELPNHRLDYYELPLKRSDAEGMKRALKSQEQVLIEADKLCNVEGFDWGPTLPSPLAIEQPNDPFPFAADDGDIRGQMFIDGMLALHEKDSKRAWRRVLALFRQSEAFTHYPGDISMGGAYTTLLSTRAAILATEAATQPLDAGAPDRALIEKLINRWLDDGPAIEAYVYRLRVERVAVLDAYAHVTAGSAKVADFRNWGYQLSYHTAFKLSAGGAPMTVELQTAIIDGMRGTKLTKPGIKPLSDKLTQFAQAGPFARMAIDKLGTSESTTIGIIMDYRASEKLATVAMALRLYRMDHNGEWPASLAALVPKYLAEVPIDPFDGKPIRYRAAGDDSIIWSVGFNLVDDGGKPGNDRPSMQAPKPGEDRVVRLLKKPAQ
jgi:hypothetical protein